MENPELDILSIDEYDRLGVIGKYGRSACVTDLCILEGGLVGDSCIDEDKSLKGRTGFFWTKTVSRDKCVLELYGKGNTMSMNTPQYWNSRAIRPVIRDKELFTLLYPKRTKGFNGVYEVEYGEYPQDAVDKRIKKELDKAEARNLLNKTGKSYTFNGVVNRSFTEHRFEPLKYYEYEYKGKKYLHVLANTSYGNCSVKLSNNKEYSTGDWVWVEVSPIKWLIDEKEKVLISKKGIISGIRFLDKDTIYDGDFNKTDIKKYMDNYLVKDINQNISKLELSEIEKKELEEERKKELEKSVEEIREKEKEKLILIQSKLKELSELLKNTELDINVDKMKIDNLRDLVFKNNDDGYIEFDEFFKNNTILKLIDLSDLELDNVDIRNIDFSNTNIHIDPQTIYNKDMTGVNATNVHFSPFLDSFDDVILDGTIITDKGAIIDLDRIKSYNEDTVIPKEVITNKHK